MQTAAGELLIEMVSFESFDKLEVTGILDLGGTPDVDLINDFMPHVGDSFDILDWTMLAGTFDDINLPTLDGDLEWDVSNLYTTGVLSRTACLFFPC